MQPATFFAGIWVTTLRGDTMRILRPGTLPPPQLGTFVAVIVAAVLARALTSRSISDYSAALHCERSCDVTDRPVPLLKPGTVIAPGRPPAGWSHLISRTNLVLGPEGDVLNAGVREAIGRFFTAFTADAE